MTKIFYFIISILIVGFLQTPIKVSPITLSETKETIIYALPYDFDEYSIYTANSYATKQWTGAVYSSLLKRSSTNHDWEEDLANTMPTISADGLTFTFSLKNNLKFSNGHGLTINDVEFSFHVALAPAINTNFYDSFVGFLDNNSINIINNQTVEFTLLKSFAFPYTLLSFPIIEEQFFEKRYNRCLQGVEIDCIWDDTEGLDAVSSGPFMIQNIDVIKGLVTLEANPYYYDAENIQTDKLVFKKIADKGEAIASLKNGTIDILDSQYVPGITELSDIGGVSEEIVADPAHIELSLNHLNPYFGTGGAIPGNEIASIQEKYDDSLLVRKAMSHIIDREFIVNVIWEGLATKATSAMPDSTIGFDETILHRNYSVEIARNYMEIAGFDYSTLGIETESGI
ncbi:MAG: hypothetical protein GPJ54_03820, partial [Candidatus Heimdallarchaeota archaeon]|nr:hypothetical protein [Candidatus Heimdallarchaeota archaeon]